VEGASRLLPPARAGLADCVGAGGDAERDRPLFRGRADAQGGAVHRMLLALAADDPKALLTFGELVLGLPLSLRATRGTPARFPSPRVPG
jgi:hypothetical protein